MQLRTTARPFRRQIGVRPQARRYIQIMDFDLSDDHRLIRATVRDFHTAGGRAGC